MVGPVSFPVCLGDVVGIRGPNGSGKSTLLNATAGSAGIFSGRVDKRPGLRVSHQQQSALPLDDVPFVGTGVAALTGASGASLCLPDCRISSGLDRLSGGQLQFLHVWALP